MGRRAVSVRDEIRGSARLDRHAIEAMPGQKTSPQVEVQSLLKMAYFCQELRPPKKTRRRKAARAK